MSQQSNPESAGPAALADPTLDQLFDRIYGELRRLAHRVREGKAGDTLDTTALVHEAWLKLSASSTLALESRSHFLAVAARAMRQIVVDSARRQLALKRVSGAVAVTLDEVLVPEPLRPERLVALDDALARLDQVDPRGARVVEHRIFGGLTADETAALLGLSRPTVERDWRKARAWLAVELRDDP
jgi:RNA polymerase sigma factor (TIGR02999 family)